MLTVLDDEDKTITAGSIVTVTVKLTRETMEVLLEEEEGQVEGAVEEVAVEEPEAEEEEPVAAASQVC